MSKETIKKETDNLLVVNNYFKPAKNKDVWINQDGKWNKKVTDNFGCIFYNGEIAESIKFKVDNRNFEILTSKDEKPSLTRITIKEEYKDLIYRTMLFNYIRIENGQMFMDVAEEEKEMKRLYFRKMKN